MTDPSAGATEVARRLWAAEAAEVASSEEIAAAAERFSVRLGDVLIRWIGADGYQALLRRAIEDARPDHPALAGIRADGGKLVGLGLHETAEDPASLSNAILATVGHVIDYLGRVVGEPMAVQLVEQAGLTTRQADDAEAPERAMS